MWMTKRGNWNVCSSYNYIGEWVKWRRRDDKRFPKTPKEGIPIVSKDEGEWLCV